VTYELNTDHYHIRETETTGSRPGTCSDVMYTRRVTSFIIISSRDGGGGGAGD